MCLWFFGNRNRRRHHKVYAVEGSGSFIQVGIGAADCLYGPHHLRKNNDESNESTAIQRRLRIRAQDQATSVPYERNHYGSSEKFTQRRGEIEFAIGANGEF